MKFGKETRRVEFVYLFGAESKQELDEEIEKYRKDKYELLQEHSLNYRERVEYNARLMKILELLE